MVLEYHMHEQVDGREESRRGSWVEAKGDQRWDDVDQERRSQLSTVSLCSVRDACCATLLFS